MANNRFGNTERFCTCCGAEKQKQQSVCPQCRQVYDVRQRCAQMNPFGAGGIGWSTQVSHPSFKKNAGKNRIASIIFALIVCIIIFVVLLIKGDMELNSNGMRLFGILMAVLWGFWIIWMIAASIPKKDWEGVVAQKDSKLEEYYSRTGDNSNVRQSRMKYTVTIHKKDGSTKKITELDRTFWYDYLHEGETVRYHGTNMTYYEKFDKTHDSYLPCAGCESKRDPRENYCGRCGCILLKGQAVPSVIPPVFSSSQTGIQGVPQAAYCRGCGQPIRTGIRFCGSCGTPVS